jgi:acyl-CoA thioesterase-2
VSFHSAEPGLDHQTHAEGAATRRLPSEQQLKAKLHGASAGEHAELLGARAAIEMRPVDVSRYFARQKGAPEQMVWMRASGQLPDTFPLHQCVLAYASDFTLLDTALIAHGKLMFDRDMQLASLDHALWFHRPFRADECCSMPKTAHRATARAAFAGATSSPAMARSSHRYARGLDARGLERSGMSFPQAR